LARAALLVGVAEAGRALAVRVAGLAGRLERLALRRAAEVFEAGRVGHVARLVELVLLGAELVLAALLAVEALAADVARVVAGLVLRLVGLRRADASLADERALALVERRAPLAQLLRPAEGALARLLRGLLLDRVDDAILVGLDGLRDAVVGLRRA